MTLSLADTNGYALPEADKFDLPDARTDDTLWLVVDDDGRELFWSTDECEAADAWDRYLGRGMQVTLEQAHLEAATAALPASGDEPERFGPRATYLVVDCNGDEFNNARFATEREADARCRQIRQRGYDAAVTVDDPDYDPTPF